MSPLGQTRAILRPGESFELRISGVPQEDAVRYARIFSIGADGFITIPLAGQVRAAGLTQSQLERAIERSLMDQKIFRWPTATITPGVPWNVSPRLDAPGPGYREQRQRLFGP